MVDDLQVGVASYQDSYRKAVDLERSIDSMANSTMKDIGQQVQTDTESIKASGIADEKQEEHDTLSTMAWTSSLILYLSVGGLLLGAVLAWLIGRGISRPVVGMCAAMRALAGGDKTVEIPGVGRKDEIGQMADTVAGVQEQHDRGRPAARRDRAAQGRRPRRSARPACCAWPTTSRPASRAWSTRSPRRPPRCSPPRRR